MAGGGKRITNKNQPSVKTQPARTEANKKNKHKQREHRLALAMFRRAQRLGTTVEGARVINWNARCAKPKDRAEFQARLRNAAHV